MNIGVRVVVEREIPLGLSELRTSLASRSASVVAAAMAQPGSAPCASLLSALNLESTSPDARMFAALNLEYMSPEAQAKLVRRRRIQISVDRHSTRRTLIDVWQQWRDTVQLSPWCIARDEHFDALLRGIFRRWSEAVAQRS